MTSKLGRQTTETAKEEKDREIPGSFWLYRANLANSCTKSQPSDKLWQLYDFINKIENC